MTSPLISKLREVRTAKGITVRKVAEALELSSAMISNVESGAREPKLAHVEQWAAALNLRLELVEENGQPLSEERRELIGLFAELLPYISSDEVEIWRAELAIRRRQLGLQLASIKK